jgi:hypothetical protein
MAVRPIGILPGMREDVSPRIADHGTLKRAENARWELNGAVVKRPGTTMRDQLAAAIGTRAEGIALGTWRERLVACTESNDGRRRWTMVTDDGAQLLGYQTRVLPERIFSCDSFKTTNITNVRPPDAQAVMVDDVLVSLAGFWTTATTAGAGTITVSDPSTGAPLRSVDWPDTTKPTCLVHPNNSTRVVYIVAYSTGNLTVRSLDIDTLVFSAAVSLAATLGNPYVAADRAIMAVSSKPGGTDNIWYLATWDTVPSLRLARLDATTITHNVTFASAGGYGGAPALCATNQVLYIAYNENSAVNPINIRKRSLGTLNAVANAVSAAGAAIHINPTVGVALTGGNDSNIYYAYAEFGGTDTAVVAWSNALAPLSLPMVVRNALGRSNLYFPPVSNNALTGAERTVPFGWFRVRRTTGLNSLVLLELRQDGAHQLAAVAADQPPGQANGTVEVLASVAVAAPDTSGLYAFVYASQLTTAREPYHTEALIYRHGIKGAPGVAADHATGFPNAITHTAEMGSALHVSGGLLADVTAPSTRGLPESGFYQDPTVSVALVAGGALTAAQVYTITACYAQRDAQGRTHRSGFAVPVTATPNGGNLTIRITASAYNYSGRLYSPGAGPVLIEFYASWNGGPFRNVNFGAPTLGGFTVAAGIAGSTSAFDYAVADATALSYPAAYIDGGILPHEVASGCRLLVAGDERLYRVGWRENVVTASLLVNPVEPVQWGIVGPVNPFDISFPARVEALAWLDGQLVVFTNEPEGCYVVTGDGPDDKGNGVFFTRKVTGVPGAIDPHVAVCSRGIVYRSARGVELLPRGLGPVEPIGVSIQETLRSYQYSAIVPTVVRGGVSSASELVYFLPQPAVGSGNEPPDGEVWVYDVQRRAWSIDTFQAALSALAEYYQPGSVDAGTLALLLESVDAAGDDFLRQLGPAAGNAPTYYDQDGNGADVPTVLRLEFTDWSPGGPLGRGRLSEMRILAESESIENGLTIELATDGELPSTYRAFTLDAKGVMLQLDGPQQQGSRFAAVVYDTSTSTMSVTRIHAIAIEAQADQGLQRGGNPAKRAVT